MRGRGRRGADREARLARRHRRPGHGEDERRDRRRRLDPRQQGRSTASASRTSRCTRPSRTASCTTRSTRRSRSSGSTASSSSPRPATTAPPNGPSGVPFAPGNDPFVITVGASDTGSVRVDRATTSPRRGRRTATRSTASRSRISRRPGRYMVGPVPATSTLLHGARRPRRRHGLHGALGHVVRCPDRQRRRGADPRQASRVHAGPGQGRA